MSTEAKKVMIIGGGIAGLTAARELSRQHIQVELVEKAAFLGGHAIQFTCKANDECQQCGACKVETTLKDVVDTPEINIHLAAEIKSITRNGKINARLGPAATGEVDDASKAYSKYNMRYYEADGGIRAANRGQDAQLDVDAVILASGFTPFDAHLKKTYQYGVLPNVITGLDLERNKRANGRLLRPSDGQEPKKIAFIQCVGSRDENLGNLWCSRVCCAYALRTAMSMKTKHPDQEITVFYMDIQTTGNNFPTFYETCRQGLTFVRTIPVDIYAAENDRIQTRYMGDDGDPVDEEFDMLVLSVGIMPGNDNPALAQALDIPMGDDGFMAGADPLESVTTNQNGIFLAGTVQGPKTIAATMSHAGQAAGKVIEYLRRTS